MAKDEAAINEAKRKKAEKKAEKLRQAEELRIKQRQEDLELELELEKFNKKLAKIKFDEVALRRNFPLITDNMKQVKATFEKVLDSKNTLINFLIERVKHSRMQRDFAHQYQVEISDRIIGMYDGELQTLHKNYTHDRESLLKRRYLFGARAANQLNKKDDLIVTVIDDMEEKHHEVMEELKGNNLRIVDEINKQNKMEFYETCNKYEMFLSRIWKMYCKVLENYKSSTQSLKKDYMDLKLKDTDDDSTIKKLAAKIARLEGFIKEFDEKVPTDERSSPREEKIKDLVQEKDTFAKVYDRLRNEIKKESTSDSQQLSILAACSHSTLKKLQAIKSKGELCLKLMMMCSKYETEEEKVLPIPSRSLSIQFLPKEDEHLNDLENLWYRHTHVIIQNRYLKHIVEQLKQEECRMRERLKYVLLEIGEVPYNQGGAQTIFPISHP